MCSILNAPSPHPRRPVVGARQVASASLFLGCLLSLVIAPPAAAQGGTCDPVSRVVSPVDTADFTRVQDYAVRSVRHDGRYHTGEDYALVGDAPTQGAPVRAVANGRVTYAYAQGWGREGGVVILEHQMPNEATYYSVYGHLAETDALSFPPGDACVQAGDVLGVIGAVSPAPHLHFEIRRGTAAGRAPGVGYTWEPPNESGYRRPARFLTNWQARLDRNIDWVTDMSLENGYAAPPLVLDDNSLIVINERRIERILPDGRQLWRKNLDREAVVALGFQGQTYIHFTDGSVQQMGLDGEFGEFWQTFAPVSAAPFDLDGTLVFPAPSQRLVALTDTRREVAWEAPEVPRAREVFVAAQVIGLHTPDERFLALARNNAAPLSQMQLRPGADAAINAEGQLIVYSQGGVWRVLADGVWQPLPYDVPAPTGYGAVARGERGDLLFYDGTQVHNVGQNGVLQWSYEVPPLAGRVQMDFIDGRALLYSTAGDVVALSPLGKTCAVRVHGASVDAYLWRNLGTDGVLRLLIGGTLTGIDWQTFSRECAA